MSTSRNASGVPTSKKFSSCVRPGVTEVRASALRPVSAFRSDDLPTFERPANATSGTAASGRNCSDGADLRKAIGPARSEEHTSELQSLMRISYAVFCLQQKKTTDTTRLRKDDKHNAPQTIN